MTSLFRRIFFEIESNGGALLYKEAQQPLQKKNKNIINSSTLLIFFTKHLYQI